jgi:3-hydroxyacyl-CoA dehydrogenase
VAAIASVTTRPQDVVGMHFFSPANIMRLVEIVRAPKTSPTTIARALALTQRIGKIGVVVGNCFGFVGNRMLYSYGRENQLMLLEGVSAERIDAVLEDFGMAMGPNAVGDLAGLDVGYRVRRERKDLTDDPRYYRVADLLVESGRLGQKSGRGMYRYEPGSRARHADPEVDALIRAETARLNIAPRDLSDTTIIERCIYALINEGAAILSDGIAASPLDIDVIWCNGYGFPRARGGPMAYADTVGLAAVYDGIRRLAVEHGGRYWSAAPLLAQLAAQNSTFAAWQAARTGHSSR